MRHDGACMADAIHDIRLGSGGAQVSNGYYAVNAAGHLVLLPPNAPLDSSMRLATEAEVNLAKRIANPPTEAPPVSEPAPDPVKGWDSASE